MCSIIAVCLSTTGIISNYPKDDYTLVVVLCRYMFACLYSLEMLIKIIARGFAFHKHAYLRDPWNGLDFVVVILG